MSNSIEILAKVTGYLERDVTLRDLEEWLAPRLAVYLVNPDSQVGQLASVIELNLAEIHSGITSERTLRKVLSQYKTEKPIIFATFSTDVGGNSVTATSSSPTVVSVSPLSEVADQGQSPAWHTGVLVGVS